MRRISSALDTEAGVAGDAALQEALRADPEAAKYAKDAARVGKWLAVWPLPEPDDAAFEALAARIEQRLDEDLGPIGDPTEPPSFDDDDALRDATAGLLESGLLESGEFRVSEPGTASAPALRASDPDIPLLSDPGLVLESDPGTTSAPTELAPPAPIARVALNKKRAPMVVDDSAGTGEPMSSADLEIRLASKTAEGAAKPQKKKKKAAGTKSSDRISIPTPKPALTAAPLAPVAELPRSEDRNKGPSPFWWFAAAAAVGIGVFGAATLFETSAEPARSGSTLVTTGAIAPSPPAPPVAAPAPTSPAAPMVPPATGIVAAAPVVAIPADELRAVEEEYGEPVGSGAEGAAPALEAPPLEGPAVAAHAAARSRPVAAATRAPRAARADGFADDELADAPDPMAHRSLGGAARTGAGGRGSASTESAPTTATATTTAPAPPPATLTATPPETGPLPTTPDRATIQTILEGRADAVRACAAGAHGLADVDVVIAASGRVTTATVNGTFAGTAVGSCIARAVRGATFPPFSQPRFQVTYPYHL